jgi:hypothetical protein
MKLWIVSATVWEYDEYDSFVIRAKSIDEARAIATAEAVAGRSPTPWHRRVWSEATVEQLTVAGEQGVVHASFRAG